jgi:AcrR family transcriptional regulator
MYTVVYVLTVGMTHGDVNHPRFLMAPPTRTPRSAWIDAGLGMLAARGPEAVRIEPLAKALGVTRGGFYGQFESRAAFLDAMLDAWERTASDDVRDQVEQRGGDARTKIRRAGALTFSSRLLPTELAVRDWSRREPAIAARLRRVDNRRMDYLRSLFRTFCADEDDVEARSVLAFSLAIGHHFMAADHGAHDRAAALELAIAQLLR